MNPRTILQLGLSIFALGSVAFAQTGSDAVKGNEAAERLLMDQIREIKGRARTGLDPEADFKLRRPELEELIKLVDDLLTQFPESTNRDEAVIAKLGALAELARRDLTSLQRLLVVTNRITDEGMQGPLRAESDYFAIEAFVLGARREGMEEAQRMEGARERYEAYLKDHPDSPRRAMVRASLIRLLLAMDRVDDAKKELAVLRARDPDDRATRRAEGEVFRATAFGQPFVAGLHNADGSTKKPEEFRGNVLVVHFWSSTTPRAVDELSKLRTLFRKHSGAKLKIVGVNVDANEAAVLRAQAVEIFPWPQVAERKGLEAQTVIETGVILLPTYFVIDANGIVQLVSNHVMDVVDTVDQLLAESPAPTPGEP